MRDPIIDKYRCMTLANLLTYRFHLQCIHLNILLADVCMLTQRRETREAARRYLMLFAVCSYSNLAMFSHPFTFSLHPWSCILRQTSPPKALRRHALPRRTRKYWRLASGAKRERKKEKQCCAGEILLYGNLEKYITKMYKYEHRKTDSNDNIAIRGVAHQHQNCMKISTIFAKLSIVQHNDVYRLQN